MNPYSYAMEGLNRGGYTSSNTVPTPLQDAFKQFAQYDAPNLSENTLEAAIDKLESAKRKEGYMGATKAFVSS
jgi:predicted DNA-binding WGR domain protein